MTQGTGRTSSWRATGTKFLLAFVVIGSLAACAQAPRRASSAPAEPAITFPDPASAAIPGGVFVDTSRLAQVQPGLARSQVYALIGMPHFQEGMDAPHWNYVFNYRDEADQVQQCQFLVAFDADDRVSDMHWQPDGCQAALLAKATQVPPVATWQPKAPVVVAPSAPASTTAPAPAASAPTPTPTPTPTPAPIASPAVGPVASATVAAPATSATAPATAVAPASASTPATATATASPASDAVLAATSQTPLPSPASTPATPVAPTPAPPAPTPVAAADSSTPAPTVQTPVASNAAALPLPLAPMPPVTLSSDAAFAPGSAKLTPAGRERLDIMLLSVQVPTQFHDLSVVGFSDRIGTAKNNLRLSQRRAETVRRYLVEGGVPADTITAIGKGEQEPVAECGKKKGKALSECLAPDRRVEINGLAPPDAMSH
ncbi:OmpA family protein [Pinirhizobacter sp.]|uniref:OmpA family protein n=1 Tax=Pinirhizobacter sp. TaxID=2950432 RepID=UPI002F3E7156